MTAPSLLAVNGIGIRFGGLKALEGLSFEVPDKSLIGLIGPNGAGKTTAFNLLSGVYQPTEGDIRIDGQSIVGLKPFQINRMGIARTFQNIRLFSSLTVFENVLIASHRKLRYSGWSAIVKSKVFISEETAIRDRAQDLLAVFGLKDDLEAPAQSLPYGKQRRLEIVRALATGPKLLLLDEPAAGMNPAETRDLMNLISQVRKDFGVAILLIEHDMKLVMGICESIVVLDHGVVIARGSPSEIQKNPKVIEAYLGSSIQEVSR